MAPAELSLRDGCRGRYFEAKHQKITFFPMSAPESAKKLVNLQKILPYGN